MKLRLGFLPIVLLLAVSLAGCGKSPTAPAPAASKAPAVPPAASMNFDFSLFQRNGASQIAAAHPNGVDAAELRSNWINAAVRVVYINLTVQDLFSAPIQALNAALGTQPTLDPDGTYLWTYSFTDKGHPVTLKLHARIDGQVVTWQMRATDPAATPPLADFLWFTGVSHLSNDSGYWVFNTRRDTSAVAVARIDWTASSATRRQLSFRNVETGSADFGDQLEYTMDGSDVAVIFHDASASADADISWNDATGAGSLQVPDYNGGLRACWDTQQQDVTCPQ